MFETPESKTNPPDHKPDGREEWVEDKAYDIFESPRHMFKALEWDSENTESEYVLGCVADLMRATTLGGEDELHILGKLRECCKQIADEYADQVLWPEYLKNVKDGLFDAS